MNAEHRFEWTHAVRWIWNDREESPRNEWWCFRKTFVPDELGEEWDSALLSITADSRYVLFVNGERVGRGPVRSWPFEQSFDVHSVGHLLHRGRTNCIAVLVMHFGVANFYYLRGKGGLLAELQFSRNGKTVGTLATDGTWKTNRFEGQDATAPRMSCQQAFAERIDARSCPDGWTEARFDDRAWSRAKELGPIGTEPWVGLKERDIPFLTEETVWPERVVSLRHTVPVEWSAVIDVRSQMIPEADNHANRVYYSGYIATVIRSWKPMEAVIGFPGGGVERCYINGKAVEDSQIRRNSPESYMHLSLTEGDNLLLLDVSRTDHGGGLYIGITAEDAFDVVSPIDNGQRTTPFVCIGPFQQSEIIDHQPDRVQTVHPLESFDSVKQVSAAEQLLEYRHLIRPVAEELVSYQSVFLNSVWKKSASSQAVPMELQLAVVPNGQPAPVPVYAGGDTEIIFDFGKEYSGYLSFEVEADEGTVLEFYGFEYMRDDYRQHTYGLDNTLQYVCREGRQPFTSFVRRGLRYLMLTVKDAKDPLRICGVKMLQSNFPAPSVGRFQCSDALINDIWQISKHTTKLCMEDTFVDCPAYEQVFWVGDSRNEALVSYYLFGTTEIVRRCLRLVPGSKIQTPLYADQVPSGWNSVIPNWTFFWVLACTEYVNHTGDLSFGKSIWPDVKYTLDHYLQRLDDRGLFNSRSWNLLDWAPIDQPDDGVVSHQNMILVKTLHAAADLAAIAGATAEAEAYRNSARALKKAINEQLWSEEARAYVDCIHADGRVSSVISMQTQVMAYLCAVAEGERRDRIEAYLLTTPEGFVPIGSPFMSFFYYEALLQSGKTDRMLEDMRINYGQMIEHDATTCWEMYPNFFENRANPSMLTRSHCHAWSAGPGYFLGAYVLGVRNEGPGWEKVVVAPRPAGLKWAKGTVPVPERGQIEVSWRVDGRTMEIQVGYPAGTQLEIVPPEGLEVKVTQREIG